MIAQTLLILCCISISQILLISFYLFIKKKGNAINKFLVAALLIIWSVFISGSIILLMGNLPVFVRDIGHLMNLTVFLLTPILYIHFGTLFKPEYKIKYRDLIHALPFIIIFGVLFNEIVINRKVGYVFYPTAVYLVSFLFVQNIVYFVFLLRDLKRVSESSYDKSKLRFFKILFVSALVLFTLKLVIFVIWNVLQYVDICIFMTGIFFLVVFLIINSFVIFSMDNPELLVGSFKYQSVVFSKEELENHLKRIDEYLLGNKNYTDPLLSLEKLSKGIKIPEKQLSQIINQASRLNFNDFINKYRIENAKAMITAADSRKILEIAYECGFNSKTTFNTAFKKLTGQTPTEFKKNLSLAEK